MQSPTEGTIYIVSGGWGAPLYSGSPEWFTAYGPEKEYNFVVVDIFENTLHLQAIGTDGETFDEYFIQKVIQEVDEGALPITAILAAAVVVVAIVIVGAFLLRRK